MKIVQQLSESRHGGIVFINSSAASTKDMTLAIAVMSKDESELAILESDAPEVLKIKALMEVGFKPSFGRLKSGNYFICQQSSANSMAESKSEQSVPEVFDAYSMNEANISTDLPNNSVTDPAPVKTKRPVVYKRKVVGLYNEATEELEIDDEYHVDDHDYLLLEPCDDMPYWEIEDGSLDSVMAMKDKPVKESKLVTESGQTIVTEACEMAIAASKFLNY